MLDVVVFLEKVQKDHVGLPLEVEATKHLDQCHQLHYLFLLCHLKCFENVPTMTMKKEWHLWHYKLHVFQDIFLTFWWSCFNSAFKFWNTSFGHVRLILSTSSFQSFATMGYLWYSQCLSSHKSIIISNLTCVYNLMSTWRNLLGSWGSLNPTWSWGSLNPTLTLNPKTSWEEGDFDAPKR